MSSISYRTLVSVGRIRKFTIEARAVLDRLVQTGARADSHKEPLFTNLLQSGILPRLPSFPPPRIWTGMKELGSGLRWRWKRSTVLHAFTIHTSLAAGNDASAWTHESQQQPSGGHTVYTMPA